MKTTKIQEIVEAPAITRNPELNKENNADFFPEKMEKARQIIARAGLPLVKQQKPSGNAI